MLQRIEFTKVFDYIFTRDRYNRHRPKRFRFRCKFFFVFVFKLLLCRAMRLRDRQKKINVRGLANQKEFYLQIKRFRVI